LDDVFIQLDIQAAINDIAQHQNDANFFKNEISRHQPLVTKQIAAANTLDSLKRDLVNSQRAMQDAIIRKQRLNELRKRYCISAPVGWLVIDRSVETGQWVNEGETIGHVGDYSKLLVPVALTEHELAALARKDKIDVRLVESQITVPAFIEHISPAFDENTRKIQVDLVIKEGVPEFRGGIRVEIAIELPGEDQVFTLPQNAVDQRFEEYWLHRKDGKSIRVNLLSQQKDGSVKINSPEIKVGDQFEIIHK
ncbi:MAG: efflux RND transporter periplasmic adaptor subunit, partial [Gammaproteobacteria bacterium]